MYLRTHARTRTQKITTIISKSRTFVFDIPHDMQEGFCINCFGRIRSDRNNCARRGTTANSRTFSAPYRLQRTYFSRNAKHNYCYRPVYAIIYTYTIVLLRREKCLSRFLLSCGRRIYAGSGERETMRFSFIFLLDQVTRTTTARVINYRRPDLFCSLPSI